MKIKQFCTEYFDLLKRSKVFLLINLSIVANIWCSAFLSHNLLSLICLLYCIIVLFSTMIIDLYYYGRNLKELARELREEEKLLNFWSDECNKLFLSFQIAQNEFRLKDAEEIMEKYKTAYRKYSIELERISKKYNIPAKIQKV